MLSYWVYDFDNKKVSYTIFGLFFKYLFYFYIFIYFYFNLVKQ